MAFGVCDAPLLRVWVRKEFLYNFEKGHGELIGGNWISIRANKHEALLFETMLDNGSMFDKLPIEAFVTREDAEIEYEQHELAVWDIDTWWITQISKASLRHMDCYVRIGKKMVPGQYLTTIDQFDVLGEVPTSCASQPEEHKTHNIILLENGQIAVQPNNRVLWSDPSMTKITEPPDWIVCKQKYFSNTNENYNLTDAWFYEAQSTSSEFCEPLPEPEIESS